MELFRRKRQISPPQPKPLDRSSAGYVKVTLAALRVLTGLIVAAHGVQKLGNPAGTAVYFDSVGIVYPAIATWLAIAGEFLGGLGLVVGLFTRVAALGPLCTMIVAILTVHMGHGLFARNGGWEFPMLVLFVCAHFVARGGGSYSVDGWLKRSPRRRAFTSTPSPGEPLPIR